jgi:hypothetical protein
MKWVTRSHVHVDRVACPWLIARFIDSEAEFIYVAKNQVEQVVTEMGAIPYDVPNVELGHKNGKCSFESIVEKYGLTDPALLRLAKIIHAADIESELHTDAIAAGLEAIATGFGVRFPDDLENSKRQLEVYDALYAWCRLQAAREDGVRDSAEAPLRRGL